MNFPSTGQPAHKAWWSGVALAGGLLALLLLLFLPSGPANSVPGFGPRNDTPAQFRDGIVLLAFQSGVAADRQQAILASVGGVVLRRIGVGTEVVRIPPGRVLPSIRMLKQYPEIRYAEPDIMQSVDGGPAPNDTNFGVQWALQNTGQIVSGSGGVAGADERAVPSWGVTTGTTNVVVAVLDTGVQYSHPDLVSNMWSNPGGIGGCAVGTHGYQIINGASSCDPMDLDTAYNGHGSHVAGIIGAMGNNGAGVSGVNWTTSIMAVKWIQNNGGTAGFSSDLVSAMDFVISAKQAGVNVRVVNDSATWPGTAFSQAVSDEIDALGANDILFVTAAGNTAQNNDTTPRYPCSYSNSNMICVAASTQNDGLWNSSNYGVGSVDLAAPGTSIVSTLRLCNYGYISGTSMSAAEVSGAAALILSLGYQPVASLKSAILNNVDQLSSLSSFVSTGGRLNICKAIPGCSTATTGIPVNSAIPQVSNQPGRIPHFGSVLGASTGTWSGIPTSYSYQWNRCNGGGTGCVPITGAKSANYAVLADADTGSTFTAAVTASNTSGSKTATSAASGITTRAAPPFNLTSTIADGAQVSGSVTWQVTPGVSANFLEFFIDGVLMQTDSAAPYIYNNATTGKLDTTTLANGTHVLGALALSADNETYSFSGATVTVANQIALVQSAAVEGSGVSSVAAKFNSNNAAANLIIAFVRMSSSNQTVTIADTIGNIYHTAVSQTQTTDGHQVYIFYAQNILGGANTVTATFSAINNHPWIAIYEFNGLSTINPLDQNAHAQGSSSSPSTGAMATTRTATELIFAGLGMVNNFGGTVTPGSGFGLQQQDTNTSRATTETLVVSSTGSYTGTFSLDSSTNWSAVVATFASASSMSATPTPAPTATATPKPTASATRTPTATYSATGTATATSTSTPTNTATATSSPSPTGTSISTATDTPAPTVTPTPAPTATPTITPTPTPGATDTATATPSPTPTSAPSDSATATSTPMITATASATATPASTATSTDTTAPTATATAAPTSTSTPSPITLLQSKSVEGSFIGSVSTGFTASNTAGNLIVAFVRMSTSTQTVAVTDSAGNTYTDAVAQPQTTDGHQIHIFYARNITGGPNTVTATFSASNNHPWLAIYEYSGLNQNHPLDQTAHAQGSNSSPSTGPSGTTTNPNELVFVGLGMVNNFGGTVTVGNGYGLQLQDTNTSRAANETLTVSSTGPFTGTFRLNAGTNWSAVLATFTP